MASSSPNKVVAARAAAILTNAEVKSATSLDLNAADGARASVEISFTKGSLTNGIFEFYVSMDGSTWFTLRTTAGGAMTQTLTADATISVPVFAPGWKYLSVGATGTGTVTSSSAAVNFRYLRRGTQ